VLRTHFTLPGLSPPDTTSASLLMLLLLPSLLMYSRWWHCVLWYIH
jgi:hypothetical protein